MEAAIPDISGNADPQAVDKDWLSNFIDKVKTIPDEDAQNIWGKILSGETNTPGSFRSEEHTSELQSLMRISYAVFCLKKQKYNKIKSNKKHKEVNQKTILH